MRCGNSIPGFFDYQKHPTNQYNLLYAPKSTFTHKPTARSTILFLEVLPTELLTKIFEPVLQVPTNYQTKEVHILYDVGLSADYGESRVCTGRGASVLQVLLSCRRIYEVAQDIFYKVNPLRLISVSLPYFIAAAGPTRLKGIRSLTLSLRNHPHIERICQQLQNAMPSLMTLRFELNDQYMGWAGRLDNDQAMVQLKGELTTWYSKRFERPGRRLGYASLDF